MDALGLERAVLVGNVAGPADISDIRRVMTVIKDGRIYDPAAIYRALGIRPCCEQASREVDP